MTTRRKFDTCVFTGAKRFQQNYIKSAKVTGSPVRQTRRLPQTSSTPRPHIDNSRSGGSKANIHKKYDTAGKSIAAAVEYLPFTIPVFPVRAVVKDVLRKVASSGKKYYEHNEKVSSSYSKFFQWKHIKLLKTRHFQRQRDARSYVEVINNHALYLMLKDSSETSLAQETGWSQI